MLCWLQSAAGALYVLCMYAEAGNNEGQACTRCCIGVLQHQSYHHLGNLQIIMASRPFSWPCSSLPGMYADSEAATAWILGLQTCSAVFRQLNKGLDSSNIVISLRLHSSPAASQLHKPDSSPCMPACLHACMPFSSSKATHQPTPVCPSTRQLQAAMSIAVQAT